MSSLIQVENFKDRVVNTTPSTKVDASNVEIVPDESAVSKHLIEIPERKKRAFDSDTEASSDYDFLANQSKISPPKEPEEQEKKAVESDNDEKNLFTEKKTGYDSDSDKSRKSYKSRVESKPLDTDSYKPRYTTSPSSLPAFVPIEKPKTQADILQEKTKLLYWYNEHNKDNKYSSKILNMDNSLDEIKGEYEYIMTIKREQNGLSIWKRNLLVLTDGLIYLNNKFDPFDVDMSDWSQDMYHQVMEQDQYDEVLSQIINKWSARLPQSPELKLIGLIALSFGYGVFQKKRAKKLEDERKQKIKREKEVDNKIRATMEQNEYLRAVFEQQQSEIIKMKQQMQQQQQFQPSIPAQPILVSSVKPTSFQGPSSSAEEMKQLYQSEFMDETIVDDTTDDESVSVHSVRSARSDRSTEKSRLVEVSATDEVIRTEPVKRKRGRPPKNANAHLQTLSVNIAR